MAGEWAPWRRRVLLGLGAAIAVLAVAAPAAWANSATYTTGSWWQQSGQTLQDSSGSAWGTCNVGAVPGSPAPVVGYGAYNGGQFSQWAAAYLGATVSLPGGATLIGGTVSGTVVEASVSGQALAPAGSYYVGVYDGFDNANPQVQGANCLAPYAYGTASGTLGFPGNQNSVSFSFDGYNLLQGFLARGGEGYGEALSVGGGIWYAPTSTFTLVEQYAYTPTGIAVNWPCCTTADQAQATVTWGANGNAAGTVYDLQREALQGSSVVAGWSTIYQGTATSFQTTGQTCGTGYVYRVNVPGPDASTPWDTSAQWDTYPCGVSFSSAFTTSITVSWSNATPQTAPEIVWCQEGTPAGGVSCSQQYVDLGTGTTSVTLTGLTPNAEYAVWACAQTDPFGCPELNAWTYAATPTLSPNNNVAGLSYDQQPLTWTANGNAAGTVYDLQQGAYAQSGTWQGGTVIYSGTATAATANQSAGGSYAYNAWAVNAGYGGSSPASNGVLTQVASALTLATTGTTTADLTWPVVANETQTAVQCRPKGGSWSYQGTSTSTSWQVTGLQPNTGYYCAIYAVASNQGIQWWQGTSPAVYTDAAQPTNVAITSVAQTSINDTWSANGNPSGTLYQTYLEPASAGAGVDWQTTYNSNAIYGGLTCGVPYTPLVQAQSANGQWTSWTAGPATVTVPCQPSGFTGAEGGLGWSATSGRGYVNLSWNPVAGATGYDVLVWDGTTYESFNVGTATSWSSQQAAIYPPDASLYPNVAEASKSPPVFSHSAGGLNLRDQPLDLYCTTGTYYCTQNPAQNYWFAVDAYNASGNSDAFQGGCAGDCYQPTLPLQTDPGAPTVTDWSVNGGAAYTYSSTVPYTLTAAEGTSGIATHALSNNGSTWTQIGNNDGCVVGQVAPCSTILNSAGTWALTPGPGAKTVYARVESAAGVWSPPTTTTVYVNTDQTVPTVDVTLNGGAAASASTSVTVAVDVSDPAGTAAGATWQARYSTDGGQTWSAWQSEGSAMSWSTSWSIPGGAPGERTVLAQVENSDGNLGQGGATIDYAAPGSGAGASLPAGGASHACSWTVGGTQVSATCVTQSQVTVPVSAPSGAVQMRVSLDDVTWGPWQPVGGSIPVDLGASPGPKTVWLQFQDAQGSVTALAPVYYVYDPQAPTVAAAWLGNASATDSAGNATLQVQAADDVGTAGMTVAVTENGGTLYQGPYANSIPLALTGSGYQVVQVSVTDAGGTTTSVQEGIYVE